MKGLWKKLFGKHQPPVRRGLDWVLVEPETCSDSAEDTETQPSSPSTESDEATAGLNDPVLI